MSENEFPNIPGYIIKKIIGKGGMGIVYLAIQTALDREVALKVTLPSLAEMDESFTKRFVREAKATAALNHPNIITIYDAGVHENSSYMAMEYISTGTLADLEQRSLSQDEICGLFIGIGLGLNAAHKAGFVHRDIKPDNILIDANGNPQVTDFGIVKSLGAQNTALTLSGGTIGTPQYMSPEQIKADTLDGRSDLYSVGVMLFNLLEGHVPFYDETPSAVYIKHVTTPAPPLSNKNKAFQPIIKTLLRKNPKNRFEGAEKFVDALRKLQKNRFVVTANDIPIERVRTKINVEDISSPNKQIKRKMVTGAPTLVSIESVSKNNKYKAIGALVLVLVFAGGFFAYNKFSQNDVELRKQNEFLAEEKRNQEHRNYWDKIKQINSVASYQNYIDTYPQGSNKSHALELLNKLKQLDKEALEDQIESTANAEQKTAQVILAETNLKDITVTPAESIEITVAPIESIETTNELAVEGLIESNQMRTEPQNATEKNNYNNQDLIKAKRIDQLFKQADMAVKQWNLMLPKGNNAYDIYKKILHTDPLNTQAKKGILEIIEKYVSLSSKNVKENNFRQAKNYLNNALTIREQYIASGYEKNEYYGVSQSVSISSIRSYKGQINKQEAMFNISKNSTPPSPKTSDQLFNEGLMAYKSRDYSTAWALLNKAVEQNHPQSQALLGTMYEQGAGVVQNFSEALNWHNKAAKQGDSTAQYNLAMMYYHGKGVAQNNSQAMNWLTKAANVNNSKAQAILGKMYYKGEGVKKDFIRAFNLYVESANQGHDVAQYRLGNMYFQGKGVKKDYDQSFAWYKKSADQNNVDAIGLLGAMYEYGRGVRKNSNKAIELYKKAAKQGDKFSIKKLRKRGISKYD